VTGSVAAGVLVAFLAGIVGLGSAGVVVVAPTTVGVLFAFELAQYLLWGDRLWRTDLSADPVAGLLAVELHSLQKPPWQMSHEVVECWVRTPAGTVIMLTEYGPLADGGGVAGWVYRTAPPVPPGVYQQRWYLTVRRSARSRGRLYEVARGTFTID